MTVQDLRPNSQDTSAFYLGNIYEVLADPNVTRTTPLAKPPPFSRPRYAIWGNSLLFLSLVMSLSCALLATLLQQWARRYIRLTQLARTNPETRARMREFYAKGVDDMHIPWAVEGLPTLLHLSLFLFFGGLAVFLFNVDQEVFSCVVCWIGLFLIVYGLITLLPLNRHDSPYYTPLSKPVWFLKVSIPFLTQAVLYFISYVFLFIIRRRRDFEWHYDHGIFRGLEKEAEESAENQSSDINVRILEWTIRAMSDDDSQGKFFQVIPGLFSSNKVKNLEKIPQALLATFWRALDMFIEHTTTSNSVSKEVKYHRVDIGMDIASMIPCSRRSYLEKLYKEYDPKPVSIDRLELMTRWFNHQSPLVSCAARVRAADMLARIRMEKRDGHWFASAYKVSGLSERELRLDLALARDNMLLATVIDACRKTFLPDYEFAHQMRRFIRGFGKFEILRTLPRLQHHFCDLWNDLIQEARKPESRHLAHVGILHEIRRHYIHLHRDTDAALTDHSMHPSSYPLCDILSHRPDPADPVPIPNSSFPIQSGHLPDASPQHYTSDGKIVPRQVEETITAGSTLRPDPTTPTIIGDISQAPAATDSHTRDTSPPSAVATALQDISPVAMVSYTLRGTAHSVPASAASASNPLLPTSYVINLSVTAFPPPSHVPPLPGAESISTTTPLFLTGNTTLPRLRARGLVNTGGVYFLNAVLQLLVHTPTFWDVFRELGDLKGQLEAGVPETTTPLVDATLRFFEEFMFKEKKPCQTQQPLQQAVGEKPREDEEEKKERNAVDSFDPTYMYDAMKGKGQLKDLLVRFRN